MLIQSKSKQQVNAGIGFCLMCELKKPLLSSYQITQKNLSKSGNLNMIRLVQQLCLLWKNRYIGSPLSFFVPGGSPGRIKSLAKYTKFNKNLRLWLLIGINHQTNHQEGINIIKFVIINAMSFLQDVITFSNFPKRVAIVSIWLLNFFISDTNATNFLWLD